MNRLLVVLPNWYGETLFATPFLRQLRALRPQAYIAALGWPQCREILQGNASIDDCLTLDERGRHRALTGKWQLAQELRVRRFDAAFILRKSLSRTLLLAASGIPQRIGFANPKSGWLLTRQVAPATGPVHKAASYLPLLDVFGAPGPVGCYDYAVSEAERQEAGGMLRTLGLLADKPFVVLHPGANWDHKRWAPEHFAELGDRLADRHGIQIVISGGPGDADLTKRVVETMQAPGAGLAQTTIRQLAACLERAALVVTNDTGILHLAAALRRPVVGLYGPTSPALTGPLGEPQVTRVIHHAACCPEVPCFSPEQPPHPGMESITVDEAYAAARTLLGPGGS